MIHGMLKFWKNLKLPFGVAVLCFVVSILPSSAAPTNLADDWVYGGTDGRAHIEQTANHVTMTLTWVPNTAPGPHYRIQSDISGKSLDGTWRCLTPACHGQSGKFHADISGDTNRLVISKTEDPGGSNEWNTFTLVRAPKSATAMASQLHNAGLVELYDIHFDIDKSTIKPQSKPTLDAVAALLGGDPSLKIEISGHTDNTGTAEHNMLLSQERAAAVVSALIRTYGIDAARLQAKGFGDTRPVAPNDNERNRANNRRVELKKL
jgi:outer membrane protein OmpA-like peptidoglycan-associated protein